MAAFMIVLAMLGLTPEPVDRTVGARTSGITLPCEHHWNAGHLEPKRFFDVVAAVGLKRCALHGYTRTDTWTVHVPEDYRGMRGTIRATDFGFMSQMVQAHALGKSRVFAAADLYIEGEHVVRIGQARCRSRECVEPAVIGHTGLSWERTYDELPPFITVSIKTQASGRGTGRLTLRVRGTGKFRVLPTPLDAVDEVLSMVPRGI